MESKKYLSDEQIRQVHDAAVRAGLAPSRSTLLSGIDDRFVLSLPTAPSPSAQLFNDLMELNKTTALTDGETPLFDWLRNADLLAGPRQEAGVFRRALDSAEASAGAGPARSPRNTAVMEDRPRLTPESVAGFSEIFSTGTTSELTYVPAVEMDDLTAAMSRGRRGLVVQGPSGSGKTTAMRKLVPDERCWLSCIKKSDLHRLDEILAGAQVSGHLVIDEFHALPSGARRDVANLIEVTCGERGPEAKITIIGVNNSGEMLFEGNTNLAGRVDFIEIRQRQPQRKIEELVEKGERSANVRFTNRDALVSAARGSFILAQQLCLKALADAAGGSTTSRDIDVHVDDLAERVAADLVFFRYPIVEFARLSEAHLVTLWMLSQKTDDELSLQEVKEEFPELDPILEEIIAKRAESAGPLRQYLHIDHCGRLSCDDVQLMFYLARLKDRDWMSVAQDAGRSVCFDNGILRLARAAPEGGAPRRSILDLDVEEFWVRPEANELLAVLCVAYDTFARVTWIASLAGVAMDEVTQMGGIHAIWVDLLKSAIRADKLRTLLVTIQRDETVARYHHKIRGLIS